MGWETRSGKRYYYRKIRDGDRVFSQYVGDGPMGEAAERLDEVLRQHLKRLDLTARVVRTEAVLARRELDAACLLLAEAARAELLARGYHQHNGTWRKKRD
jgi:hypothetical protein